jgi:hypothetical protein
MFPGVVSAVYVCSRMVLVGTSQSTSGKSWSRNSRPAMGIARLAENLGQLVLQPDEGESDPDAGLELDQYVDVALPPEVVAQHGPEQRQTAYAVGAAECRNLPQ